MTQEQVVNIAAEISYLMLKNGAEIYRVEQCVRFIGNAYGYEDVDCFAILTSIVVTIVDGERVCTRTKRVADRITDLNVVTALNDLSRYICANLPEYEEAKKMIQSVKEMKQYPFWVFTVAYMVISLFFGLYFGGNWITCLLCGLAGGVVYPIQWFGDRIKANLFMVNMLTSGTFTLLLCIIHQFFGLPQLDIMIIALTMSLVPGVALTHCMRDLISNELVSGLARFAEVLISASGTAVGVFVILSMFGIQV